MARLVAVYRTVNLESATWVGSSSQSGVGLGRLLPKLGVYLERVRGVGDVRLVTAADVVAWIEAPLPNGTRPALATLHTRRAAARMGFRMLRQAGILDRDPTIDMTLASRSSQRVARPLTDNEVRIGRAAAAPDIHETRRAAAWALAEATATTHEIPRVLPEHIDFASNVVWLSGSKKQTPRLANLTSWGRQALHRHLARCEPEHPLVYSGRGDSPAAMQASASTLLARALKAAGLRDDPRILPGSVRAWAGRRVFEETGRVDAVARALGCKTLDSAALIISFDWSNAS
ncbi:MAG: hypothetical protein WEE53_11525 [Acidimicrobiia bacterium]